MQHSDLVYVKRVKGKGRGVFARKFIARRSIIEKTPVIILPDRVFAGGKSNTYRSKFFFEWSSRTVGIVLGYGSIYNHSYKPNALYEHGPMIMTFRALRDIEAGEEITINYNFLPEDRSPVSFEVK